MSDLSIKQQRDNLNAFLLMIRTAEGTYDSSKFFTLTSGYFALFGWDTENNQDNTFSYATAEKGHPNIKAKYTNKAGKEIITTAAGAYQIIYGTYKDIITNYNLPTNFLVNNQDAIATAILKRRGAYNLVLDGKFNEAVKLCRKEWASLPDSNVNQPTRSLEYVSNVYIKYGGIIV